MNETHKAEYGSQDNKKSPSQMTPAELTEAVAQAEQDSGHKFTRTHPVPFLPALPVKLILALFGWAGLVIIGIFVVTLFGG